VRTALDWFAAHHAWIDDEQARLTEIPAPTFQESERAAAVKVLLSAVGLEVTTDKTGNVIGLLRGSSDKEVVVLSAHLDTVFPPETEVKVHREKEPHDRTGNFRQWSRAGRAGCRGARDP
jgi:acetylornithine deacetylase/succinyl-diaminopimelate desuccinylase-like protein